MKRLAASLLVLVIAAGPAWAGGGRATVDSIEIIIATSFPVQVFAVLRGYLSDGCTAISSIDARGPLASRFHIEITTERPAEALCTLALVPFERNVPLGVYGLPKGTYEAVSGSVRASFTLHQDLPDRGRVIGGRLLRPLYHEDRRAPGRARAGGAQHL